MSKLNKLEEYIRDNCKAIDSDEAYREMIDECYSFKDVGGIFSNMLPSRVLEECDPVAYRCGFNDWIDSEDVCEIDGDYYRQDEADKAKEDLLDELRNELEAEENARLDDEEESESEDEENAKLDDQEESEREKELKAEIAEIEAYEFSK